jgi:hypothetical protein
MTKGITKIFSKEDDVFIRENVGKIKFTELAKMIQSGVEKLRKYCEDNEIYYPMQKYKDWENEILLNNSNLNFEQIHNIYLPHRTCESIRAQSNILKIRRQEPGWTQDEENFLIENYSHFSMNELSNVLNRTVNAITLKASKLKIYHRNILSHDEYCEYIQTHSRIIVIDGIFSDFSCFLTFKCLEHNFVWNSSSRTVYKTLRCPRCHFNKKRTHEDFVEDMKLINPNIKILSQFENTRSIIKYVCLIHNMELEKTARGLLKGRGCPICRESKGEKSIRNYLYTNNIKYSAQKFFDDLRGINDGLLKFDFCIFDNFGNIFKLIEFQGEQHYRSVSVYGGDESYAERLENDNRKRNYCEKNDIPLIEISYQDIKNIKIILEKELSPLLERR